MRLHMQQASADLILAMDRFQRATGRDAAALAARTWSQLMRRVIGITPPASSASARGRGGTLTKEDQRAGEAALRRDLARVFAPVRLRYKRPEEHPDVAAIHTRLFRASKRPGRALRRDRDQPYYVDQTKYRALLVDLRRRIGRLAARWLSGADLSRTTGIPSWVRRHGTSGGTGRRRPRTSGVPVYEAYNHGVPPALVAEMNRRVAYAARYTANALTRELRALVAKRAARGLAA